jgi:hypothetical protein
MLFHAVGWTLVQLHKVEILVYRSHIDSRRTGQAVIAVHASAVHIKLRSLGEDEGIVQLLLGLFFIAQAIVAVWDWHCFNEVSAKQGAGSPE